MLDLEKFRFDSLLPPRAGLEPALFTSHSFTTTRPSIGQTPYPFFIADKNLLSFLVVNVLPVHSN